MLLRLALLLLLAISMSEQLYSYSVACCTACACCSAVLAVTAISADSCVNKALVHAVAAKEQWQIVKALSCTALYNTERPLRSQPV
jgi:hypothetical protein